jgi:L-cysteine S-thiosulfotransferase
MTGRATAIARRRIGMRVAFVLVSVAIASAANTAPAAETPAGAPLATQSPTGREARRSGFEFMSPSTQAMQKDDTQNPGMLWVKDGEALWNRNAGKTDKSCAGCHGAVPVSMRGVAARYPAFDAPLQRPVNLAERINLCRKDHQKADPLAAESQELLSIESYVAYQSRGMTTVAANDARLEPFRERGRKLYQQRIGQLDLACAQCHDESAGQRLGGSVIPQAHPTGYPIYRLEWQGLGSLQRRLRNCLSGVRAESYPFGAQELVELELYLVSRAAGLAVETPAVRP